MTFGNAIGTCLGKYADFSGRASRSEFWFFILFAEIVYFLCIVVPVNVAGVPQEQTFTLIFLLRLPLWLPELAVTARRLHDMDQSGWLVLIILIPVLGILILLIMAMQPGTAGPNRFGQPEDATGDAAPPPPAPGKPASPPAPAHVDAAPRQHTAPAPLQATSAPDTAPTPSVPKVAHTAPVSPRPYTPSLPPQNPEDFATYINSIGMEFVLIPAGSFLMGSPEGVGEPHEHPQHQVDITRPFWLGKYPVTQAQWQVITGSNPGWFAGHQTLPVECVSWNDAQQFIAWLNAREGHNRYRLPTEAEWEYACRAGTTTTFSFGDDDTLLGRYAWHHGNTNTTQPVGQKEPNPWGLYDMHGNVWEWVWDWYNEATYAASPPQDPFGPERGKERTLRGGSWNFGSYRSANRTHSKPNKREYFIGCRLAMTVE